MRYIAFIFGVSIILSLSVNAALLPDKQYILSKSEINTLVSDTKQFLHEKSIKSLTRVIDIIIKPGMGHYNGNDFSLRHSFMAGINLSVIELTLEQGRYLFGSDFQRHAGFHQSAIVIDTKTGQIMLADFPNNGQSYMIVMSMTCTNDELQTYAMGQFKNWALADIHIEEISSDCNSIAI